MAQGIGEVNRPRPAATLTFFLHPSYRRLTTWGAFWRLISREGKDARERRWPWQPQGRVTDPEPLAKEDV